MDTKLKAAWVKALRSGEYSQVHSTLMNSDGHCCLGVLSHLIDGDDQSATERRRSTRDYGLPLSPEQVGACMDKNDLDRLSFPQIADWIEKNVA